MLPTILPAAYLPLTHADTSFLRQLPGEERSHGLTAKIYNQFAAALEHSARYLPDEHGHTKCNIFVWDATLALGCEIPHWIDIHGKPSIAGHGNQELNANEVNTWLRLCGSDLGWNEIPSSEVPLFAARGFPVVASWFHASGIGHVMMVRPESSLDTVLVAQAGSINSINIPLRRVMAPSNKLDFFYHV